MIHPSYSSKIKIPTFVVTNRALYKIQDVKLPTKGKILCWVRLIHTNLMLCWINKMVIKRSSALCVRMLRTLFRKIILFLRKYLNVTRIWHHQAFITTKIPFRISILSIKLINSFRAGNKFMTVASLMMIPNKINVHWENVNFKLNHFLEHFLIYQKTLISMLETVQTFQLIKR